MPSGSTERGESPERIAAEVTPLRAQLARLDEARDEIAKAWLVRLIERSSLEEIEGLQTERIARELPEVIADVLSIALDEAQPDELSAESAERARRFGILSAGSELSPSALARDAAALQALLVRSLGEDGAASDPAGFAEAVERLAVAVGAIHAVAVEELVARRSRELESQANTDTLTGLFNLRYVQRQLAQLLDYQRRYEHPFGLLLLDVDGLKRINDAHGHAAGDRVLVQVASAVRRSVRAVDTPARLGGDEFIVLAPHQEVEGAAALAERLAGAIEREAAAPDGPTVGVSIGVVVCPEHGSEAEGLIELADRAMYRAKASGDPFAVGGNGEASEEDDKKK
jgi:diguanylate cyclase (GGDEF)-like protein